MTLSYTSGDGRATENLRQPLRNEACLRFSLLTLSITQLCLPGGDIHFAD